MVTDASAFNEYTKKRQIWHECLFGDDHNSIMSQIHRMMWDYAVWTVVNESRGMAEKLPDGTIAQNGMLHQWIDKSFFEGQMIAIRRLCEPPTGQEKKAKSLLFTSSKAVFSLGWLLSDMVLGVRLLTREHLLEAEGHPYDYLPMKRLHDEAISETPREGASSFHVPPEHDWRKVEERHQEIDVLCGVQASGRNPVDKVKVDVLTEGRDRLKCVSKGIKVFVDKFVAHAATPGSRASVGKGGVSVTPLELKIAHKTICGLSNFISVRVLGDVGFGVLPAPRYDHLEHLDRPLATPESLDRLRSVWKQCHSEMQQEDYTGLSDFKKWPNPTV